MFLYFLLRWCSSTITKPRGLHMSVTAATGSTPLKAGSIIASLKPSSCSLTTWPWSSSWVVNSLPASTLVVLALVIHLMSWLRSSDSSIDLESPTPPSPRWPMYGSAVTKVIGTLWRSLRRRRSVSRISENS